MSEKKYYCFCSSNCKYETMTKEQILAAITQAVESGTVSDVDTGFVTKLKELNSGKAVTMWVGTTAQYNALTEHVENCIYIKVDDTTGDDLQNAVESALAATEETEAGLQDAKSFLSVAGADNGVLQDALEVAWRDTYADINKPRKVTMDTANIPADFGGGTRFVVISDSNMRFGCVVLVGQRYEAGANYGDVWVNRCMADNWNGWVRIGADVVYPKDGEVEYQNPPMEAGVEYRTMERYKGKPVYAKLIDFGFLPNNETKTLNNLVKGGFGELVSGQLLIKADYGNVQYCLCDPNVVWRISGDETYAWGEITTTADMSDCEGLLTLKYTKS